MKLAIIGATGKTGQAVMTLALERKIAVTVVAHRAPRVPADVAVIEKDVFELTTADLQGLDVVLCAYTSWHKANYPRVSRHLTEILANTPTRLVMVGAAATLYTTPHRTKKVAATMPRFTRATSEQQLKAQQIIQNSTDKLSWTYVAPPMTHLPAGPTTGRYQVGRDVLLYDRAGDAAISYPDFALALVDEIEQPQNVCSLMTVAWP